MTFLKAYFLICLGSIYVEANDPQVACTVSGDKVQIILAKHVISTKY